MIKYNENDIEVAVSTQNLKSYDDLIKKMKITSDCLIINQYDGTAPLNNKKVINKNEKGLSKSRNEANIKMPILFVFMLKVKIIKEKRKKCLLEKSDI